MRFPNAALPTPRGFDNLPYAGKSIESKNL